MVFHSVEDFEKATEDCWNQSSRIIILNRFKYLNYYIKYTDLNICFFNFDLVTDELMTSSLSCLIKFSFCIPVEIATLNNCGRSLLKTVCFCFVNVFWEGKKNTKTNSIRAVHD